MYICECLLSCVCLGAMQTFAGVSSKESATVTSACVTPALKTVPASAGVSSKESPFPDFCVSLLFWNLCQHLRACRPKKAISWFCGNHSCFGFCARFCGRVVQRKRYSDFCVSLLLWNLCQHLRACRPKKALPWLLCVPPAFKLLWACCQRKRYTDFCVAVLLWNLCQHLRACCPKKSLYFCVWTACYGSRASFCGCFIQIKRFPAFRIQTTCLGSCTSFCGRVVQRKRWPTFCVWTSCFGYCASSAGVSSKESASLTYVCEWPAKLVLALRACRPNKALTWPL